MRITPYIAFFNIITGMFIVARLKENQLLMISFLALMIWIIGMKVLSSDNDKK